MKKIVPFTKELMFKTKIGEITSIALDNTLTLIDEFVSGEFIVSGTYKMLEGSQIEEEFKYNIPVDITIDSKYETKNCIISIDDFSYEIINEEKLNVNISVMLDELDIKIDPVEKVEVILEERSDKEFEFLDSDIEEITNLMNNKEEVKTVEIANNVNLKVNDDFNDNLFNNTSDVKEYSIYRVYTLTNEDTLEMIYEKFNTTKEILADYNDLDNLSVGSKIIIPSCDE